MKMYKYIILSLLLSAFSSQLSARKQWTEKQASEWEKRVGVLIGFNSAADDNLATGDYTGTTLETILKKAKSLGYNSVRGWYRGTADEVLVRLEKDATLADKIGMTLAPVLCVPVPKSFWESKGTDEQAISAMKEYTQKVIGGVAKDKRIVIWDLWNEPGCGANFMATASENYLNSYKAIEMILGWALEMNPTQALSSSIFWDAGIYQKRNEVQKAAWELESKMDVHNFHNYICAADQGTDVQNEINILKQLGNRPIICTECLTHHNNSGLSRTLAAFSKNNVHFYQWGLYDGEANWTVKWGHTAYDPYDAEFHNLLYADGEPIDNHDLDLIRNYKFTNGVSTDPGAEFTDKWDAKRAWRWMAVGNVKGKVLSNISEAFTWLQSAEASKGFNSLNVKLSYADYSANRDAFFGMADALLAAADGKGMTVLLTLLDDNDLQKASNEELAKYESQVMHRYREDVRVKAWDLYYHPGEKITDKARLETLVKMLFRYARYEFPNQPVMATPVVKVNVLPADFNYRDAFVHGHSNGWNRFEYEGGASADLCFLIWKISDVIAFSSNQSAPQTGWVKAVAFRYGRPIFCTQWQPLDEKNANETLDNFSRSHVYWYQQGNKPALKNVNKFRFIPISTPHTFFY